MRAPALSCSALPCLAFFLFPAGSFVACDDLELRPVLSLMFACACFVLPALPCLAFFLFPAGSFVACDDLELRPVLSLMFVCACFVLPCFALPCLFFVPGREFRCLWRFGASAGPESPCLRAPALSCSALPCLAFFLFPAGSFVVCDDLELRPVPPCFSAFEGIDPRFSKVFTFLPHPEVWSVATDVGVRHQ